MSRRRPLGRSKTERRRQARGVRAALSQYLTWLEPFMAEGQTPAKVSEQQLGWLLTARDRLDTLIRTELEARAGALAGSITSDHTPSRRQS